MMLFSIAVLTDTLKNLFTYNKKRIYIDNLAFQFHYRWTVIFLVTFSVLVSSKIYIGQPITCMTSGSVDKETAFYINEYCFIHSTFTKGKYEQGKWAYDPVQENEISPGVRPSIKEKDEELIYHTYYQWVWCILMIQAAIFYFPHWCWTKIEGGCVMMLVGNLNRPMIFEDYQSKQKLKILTYFDRNRGFHNKYAFYHSVFEIVNLIHILAEIFVTDYILNYEFSTYGFNLFTLILTKPYLRVDSLARVFPTVTACRFQTGGVAFGRNQHDLICVLPINIANEKIYIFLWFWFLFVAFSSIVGILYRVCTIISPIFRKYLLLRRARFVSKDVANIVSRDSKYGDWFLIHRLSRNMNEVVFGELLKDIAETFSNGGTPKYLERKERGEVDIPFPPSDASFCEKLVYKIF